MARSAISADPTGTSADALLRAYAQAGYTVATPPILQPAEPFLDLSGEDIRKSLYLTTDGSGEELCLRPDLTIPVARDYLASSVAGTAAGFCYLGPVFRYRGGRPRLRDGGGRSRAERHAGVLRNGQGRGEARPGGAPAAGCTCGPSRPGLRAA